MKHLQVVLGRWGLLCACAPCGRGVKSTFCRWLFALVTFLISCVPFSPRPPCLPPKPQKMRRPRPLSVYSHKLFNGSMEAFIKVLAGEPWIPRTRPM